MLHVALTNYNLKTFITKKKINRFQQKVSHHLLKLPYPSPETYQKMISTPPTSTISRQFLFQELMLFNDDNMNDMNDECMMNNSIDSPEQYSVTGFTCDSKNRRNKRSRKYTTSLEVIQEEGPEQDQHQQEREAANENDDENDNDDDAFSSSFSPISTSTTTDFCLSQRRMKKSKSVSSSLSSLLFSE
mmetsp:Transcript_61684/g.69080  ORF Transcript_61684/g.69080 Transcript_61684/m.69080 type:complete len:188 (+) Transcript_61684:37-600(+)